LKYEKFGLDHVDLAWNVLSTEWTPILKKSLRKTCEKKFWKFLRKKFFRWISTHLNGVGSVCMHKDSIFST
jgi:hypothetical protein